MNIAFPALIIFLLVLPGIIFRSASSHAGRYRVTQPLSDEIGRSVIAAIIINAVFLQLANLFGQILLGLEVDPGIVLDLLNGKVEKTAPGSSVGAAHITQFPGLICLYLLGMYSAAYGAGAVVKGIQRRAKTGVIRLLQNEPHALRFEEWQQTIYHGEKGEELWITICAVVPIAGSAYLFRGRLVDVFFDGSGTPERFVIEEPDRRKIGNEHDFKHHDNTVYPIRGTNFILRYSEIVTLNFLHYVLTLPEEVDQPQMSLGFMRDNPQDYSDSAEGRPRPGAAT